MCREQIWLKLRYDNGHGLQKKIMFTTISICHYDMICHINNIKEYENIFF